MGNVDHLDASCFSSGQTPDGKMRGESVCVYFDVDNKLFFTKKKSQILGCHVVWLAAVRSTPTSKEIA